MTFTDSDRRRLLEAASRISGKWPGRGRPAVQLEVLAEVRAAGSAGTRSSWIARKLNRVETQIAPQLSRLVAQGEIERVERGLYRSRRGGDLGH